MNGLELGHVVPEPEVGDLDLREGLGKVAAELLRAAAEHLGNVLNHHSVGHLQAYLREPKITKLNSRFENASMLTLRSN